MAAEIHFLRRLSAAWKSASTVNTILIASLMTVLCVIAVGLFSPFGLSIFDDAGSAADWFAAVGTWVIGFGAMRLAAGDRELKLHERRERRLQEAKIERSRFREVSGWASNMRVQIAVMSERLSVAETDRPSSVLPALKPVADAVRSIRWGVDEHNIVGEDTARIVARAHYELEQIRDLTGAYDAFLRRGVIDLDDMSGDLILEDIREFADRADTSLARMQDSLLKDAQPTITLIDSLEARLAREDRQLTGD